MSQRFSKFLPFSKNVIDSIYLQHHKLLKRVTKRIDTGPPKMELGNFVNFKQFRTDFNTFKNIMEKNNELLQRINTIQRLGGKVDSQTPKYSTFKQNYQAQMSKDLSKVEKENFILGNRIMCAKSKVDSIRPLTKEQKKAIARQKKHFELPTPILRKYNDYLFKIPQHVSDQRKLFRPKFYIDLAIKHIRKLDRIVVQLFTEAAPQVVLEFMRMSKTKSKQKLTINRLFPNLWLEGEIALEPQCDLVRKPLEYDKRVMGHEMDLGILSFPERYLKGFSCGFLSFNISFRPLNCLNGERVAFGRIIRGKRTFENISTFGRQNGRPFDQIIVQDCGMI